MPFFTSSLQKFPTPTITADAYAIPFLPSDRWFEEAAEGELAVDVYETGDRFVVQSTIAGVCPGDLTLSLQRDLLTIRGKRAACTPDADAKHLTQECYWGNFSRSILLPEPIDVPRASAVLKQGILTVTLPKLVERTHIDVSEIA